MSPISPPSLPPLPKFQAIAYGGGRPLRGGVGVPKFSLKFPEALQ